MIAESPRGEELTYTIAPVSPTTEVPAGLTISSNGLITWTPTIAQAGAEGAGGITYYLRVSVDDESPTTQAVDLDLTLLVLRPEDYFPAPPEIDSTAPNGATADQELVYEPTTTSEAQSGLQWFLSIKPDGMVIDQNSGRITWTPAADLVGETVDVKLHVFDGTGAGDNQTFTLLVGGVNRQPTFDSTFPNMWRTGQAFSFDVLASDPEGHALTYELLTSTGDPPPQRHLRHLHRRGGTYPVGRTHRGPA